MQHVAWRALLAAFVLLVAGSACGGERSGATSSTAATPAATQSTELFGIRTLAAASPALTMFPAITQGAPVVVATSVAAQDAGPTVAIPPTPAIQEAAGSPTETAVVAQSPPASPSPTAAALPSGGPDSGGLILFESDRDGASAPAESGPRNFELYSMHPDGAGVTRLTENVVWDGNAEWSPNHRRIAFDRYAERDDEIFVMNSDSTQPFQVTNSVGHDKLPTWSPDRQRLAFRSMRDGNREIYLVGVDGSELARLTDDPAKDDWPAWSPTGGRILFNSRRDGNWEIYAVNVDGSGLTNLSNHPMQDLDPIWSPDGQRIASISNRSSWVELYTMNADGSDVTQVTRIASSASIDSGLAWSPDGALLVFTATMTNPSGSGGNVDICHCESEWIGVPMHYTASSSRPGTQLVNAGHRASVSPVRAVLTLRRRG